MDMTEIVKNQIGQIDCNAIFQKALEKQISETIEYVLKDSVGKYSEFSKALEKKIEQKISVDLEKVTLPQYHNFVVDQCMTVIESLMTEERAAVIKKTFVERLAPNLEKEVQFEDLIESIVESLSEVYKEESCDPPVYNIVVKKEEKYSSTYWELIIHEGEKESYLSEMASLFLSGNKCYHSRGDKRSEFTRRFASYVFNQTLVHGVYELSRKITYEDFV